MYACIIAVYAVDHSCYIFPSTAGAFRATCATFCVARLGDECPFLTRVEWTHSWHKTLSPVTCMLSARGVFSTQSTRDHPMVHKSVAPHLPMPSGGVARALQTHYSTGPGDSARLAEADSPPLPHFAADVPSQVPFGVAPASTAALVGGMPRQAPAATSGTQSLMLHVSLSVVLRTAQAVDASHGRTPAARAGAAGSGQGTTSSVTVSSVVNGRHMVCSRDQPSRSALLANAIQRPARRSKREPELGKASGGKAPYLGRTSDGASSYLRRCLNARTTASDCCPICGCPCCRAGPSSACDGRT